MLKRRIKQLAKEEMVLPNRNSKTTGLTCHLDDQKIYPLNFRSTFGRTINIEFIFTEPGKKLRNLRMSPTYINIPKGDKFSAVTKAQRRINHHHLSLMKLVFAK